MQLIDGLIGLVELSEKLLVIKSFALKFDSKLLFEHSLLRQVTLELDVCFLRLL